MSGSVATSVLGLGGYLFASLWGAIWGSFMNVCITRIPDGESIVWPGSHCRACGGAVRWYDNLPIVSFFVLGGKCRSCHARFSPKYAIVEVLAAALAVALWHVLVVRSGQPLPRAIGLWLLHFAFVGVLIVISFIDLATFRIPNTITYPGIPLFTAASLLLPHPHWWDGPVGAVAGYAALRLLSDGYFWMTGREGMGYGDAKLLALTAGFLGWRSLLPTVFLGSLVGSVFGISMALLARRRAAGVTGAAGAMGALPADSPDSPGESGAEPTSIRHVRVPFGPFLAVGALVFLFIGDPLDHIVHLLLP